EKRSTLFAFHVKGSDPKSRCAVFIADCCPVRGTPTRRSFRQSSNRQSVSFAPDAVRGRLFLVVAPHPEHLCGCLVGCWRRWFRWPRVRTSPDSRPIRTLPPTSR